MRESKADGRRPYLPVDKRYAGVLRPRCAALFLFLLLGLTACYRPLWLPPTAVSPTPTQTTIPTATPEIPLPTPTTAAPVEVIPTPLLEGQVIVPTRIPTDLALDPRRVSIYPSPQLYAGDLATLQFVANLPPDIDPGEVAVAIYVNEEKLVEDRLNWRNFANEPGGLYSWVWDTTAAVGRNDIVIILDPAGEIPGDDQAGRRVSLEVEVLPADPGQNQSWIGVETDCCFVYVISETAAHRDIEYLAEQSEIAFVDASASLQEPMQRRYDVYFIDRVIGQGGYAANSIVISYLDRNYAGLDLSTVLHHEAVHLIDRQFAPNRIPFLAEGVAVWAAGGHYKPENLDRRAAALIAADLHTPLRDLADNFYPSQHEIGYLQAGSFISYLVETYGWTAVRDFYANPAYPPVAAPTHSDILDFTLQRHFDQTLAEAEANWLAYLSQQRRDRDALPDLETTIAYYETLRAYQRVYDPSAYFLTAWLPLPEEARERAITADFSRRPTGQMNLILETMLIAAHQAKREGDYRRSQAILSSVNRIIDSGGQFLDPLGLAYQEIMQRLTAAGYLPQTIDLKGEQATATAVRPLSLNLQTINLSLEGQNWVIVR